MNTIKSLLTLAAVGALMFGSAHAALTVYRFDENGNSSQSFVTHQQATDTATGVATLDYLYPDSSPFFSLSSGWVAIYDDPGQTQLSDLIHFGPRTSQSQTIQDIFFYSSDNTGALADHWLTPSQIASILAGAVKISENAAGVATYTPADGSQPGFLNGGVPDGFGNSFVFVSAVPEPGTYGAFASALGLFCLASGKVAQRLRRRQVAA